VRKDQQVTPAAEGKNVAQPRPALLRASAGTIDDLHIVRKKVGKEKRANRLPSKAKRICS